MKLKHKQKVLMAKKMLTKQERKDNVSIFDSHAWKNRKESIEKRINKITK
jgi:hypothetical protein